jgi:iron complex transport system ATP-binding protein
VNPSSPSSSQPRLEIERLTLGYGDRDVVHGLDLVIPPGEVTAIVGPNACGKSTLLRSMTRLLSPRDGRVLLDGKAVHSMPAKQLARRLGLLPQSPIAPEGITVGDLVGRGRHPHQRTLSRWSPDDDRAVTSALKATDTLELIDRAVDELSGGQRQRVWIAMALAQESEVLLLDEPTTFLDVSHQVEVLDLLTDLNRAKGTTIVMVLHDLNLAARYADHLIALCEGRLYASGRPSEVLEPGLVKDVFGMPSTVIPDPVSGKPMVVPIGRYHVSGTQPAEASGGDLV